MVENRPGGGGNIGADAVAKAAPDGTTIGISAVATHAINPWLFTRMPYDPVKDFAPITQMVRVPNVLVMQMAVFVRKALGQQALSWTGGVFSDVNSAAQPEFCGWIEKFSQLGITSGCRADDPATVGNERMYCPNDPVTRAQMAVFLSKGFLQ